MTLGRTIVETIYNAMHYPAFRDSPFAPWRDPTERDCLDRVCMKHESCARREAFCTFGAWFERAKKEAQ